MNAGKTVGFIQTTNPSSLKIVKRLGTAKSAEKKCYRCVLSFLGFRLMHNNIYKSLWINKCFTVSLTPLFN